jgi:hypothetical protein
MEQQLVWLQTGVGQVYCPVFCNRVSRGITGATERLALSFGLIPFKDVFICSIKNPASAGF